MRNLLIQNEACEWSLASVAGCEDFRMEFDLTCSRMTSGWVEEFVRDGKEIDGF